MTSGLNLFSIKTKRPGLNEFNRLLDFLPKSAVVVQSNTGDIIWCNSKAIQLSTYTRNELIKLKIDDLILNYSSGNYSVSHPENPKYEEAILIRRSGSNIPVEFSISNIDAEHHWKLILFSQEEILNHEAELSPPQFPSNAFEMLSSVFLEPDEKLAIEKILATGLEVGGFEGIGLYISDLFQENQYLEYTAGNPGFKKTISKSFELSDHYDPTAAYIFLDRPDGKNEIFLSTIDHPTANAFIIAAHDKQKPTTFPEAILQSITNLVSSYYSVQHKYLELVNIAKHSANENKSVNAIKNLINDGILFIRPDLIIEDINSNAEISLGYHRGEVLNKPLSDILISDKSLNQQLKNELKNGSNNIDLGTVKIHRRDGQKIPAHIRAIPIETDGGVDAIAILITNLSKDEEYSQHIKQLEDKAKLGEITAVLAHELRNPINNISTGVQVMALNFEKDDPIQEDIFNLKEECDRINDLMRSILSFVGTRRYKFLPIDLDGLIRRIISKQKPVMQKNNISDHIFVKITPAETLGDIRAIERVFANLIDNAIQAMTPNGGDLTINIAESKDKSNLEIGITDSGKGISKDLVDKIFDPMFTTKKEGTGLGLSITKQIVAAHNGKIEVRSIPGGTVFKVSLPKN